MVGVGEVTEGWEGRRLVGGAALRDGEVTVTGPRAPDELAVSVSHGGKRFPAVFQARSGKAAGSTSGPGGSTSGGSDGGPSTSSSGTKTDTGSSTPSAKPAASTSSAPAAAAGS